MRNYPVMRFLLASVVLLSFAGCASDAVQVNATNNPSVSVELLFENDGVKVYRFRDNLRYHYFADARGSVETIVSEGKTTRIESIPTVNGSRPPASR